MLLKFYLSTRIFKDDLAILLDNLAAIEVMAFERFVPSVV